MAHRLPSDHDSVRTSRVSLTRLGRTDRPQIRLPEEFTPTDGDVIEVILDDSTRYSRVDETLDGSLALRRITDSAELAREDEGRNRMEEWIDGTDVRIGDSVLLDTLTQGRLYGLRAPGTRLVYAVPDPPPQSLVDIARSLDE